MVFVYYLNFVDKIDTKFYKILIGLLTQIPFLPRIDKLFQFVKILLWSLSINLPQFLYEIDITTDSTLRAAELAFRQAFSNLRN